MSEPADILTHVEPPPPGRFWPDRVTADALAHHIVPLRLESDYCGHPKARRVLLGALEGLQLAIDMLRTERHR